MLDYKAYVSVPPTVNTAMSLISQVSVEKQF